MMTLICQVFGDQDSFPIDISGDKLVGHLKQLIHAKKNITFRGIEADKLKLWKWNRPDDEINDSELGDQDKLSARKTLNQVFGNGAPNPEFIHIIIKADTPAAPPADPPSPPSNSIERKLDMIVDVICNKKVCISRASNTQYQSILKSFDIKDRVIKVRVPPTTSELMDNGFRWGPGKEDSQINTCLEWLAQVVEIPSGMVMLSAVNNRDLLNCSSDHYNITGTTDIVIVPEPYYTANAIGRGIQVAIELKIGDVDAADHRQAVLQLLTASTVSNFPVVVILTNLNDYWQFFWISSSGILQTDCLKHSYALTLFRGTLNEDKTSPLQNRYTLEQYVAQKSGLDLEQYKAERHVEEFTMDQYLSGVKTKVHPYDLLSKPDVGNMEEHFCDMEGREIRKFKEKFVFDYLRSTPTWQAMYG